MNRYLNFILAVLIIILLGNYSCEQRWDLIELAPCPSITSITQNARVGDVIALEGKFVNYDLIRDRITIGGIATDPEAIFKDDTMMEVIVPEGITDSIVSIVVTINDCSSNENINLKNGGKILFNYDKVTVTALSSDKAKHGEEIIISGTNFREGDMEANLVFFNGNLAEVIEASSTELTVKVPKNELTPESPTGESISGPVSVVVDDFVASNTPEFTYVFTATVSLLAGSINGLDGAIDGIGDSARFNEPQGIDVFISEGNTTIYIADTGNHVIRRIDPILRKVFLFAGVFMVPNNTNNDTELLEATFNRPEDVAVDLDGNLFVTESGNRSIRGLFPNSNPRTKRLAGVFDSISRGEWIDSSAGVDARFHSPKGITVSNSGLIYVSDDVDNRIRVINKESPYSVTTLAGAGILIPGCVDGIGIAANFSAPSGLFYDPNKDLIYVADFNSKNIRSISTTGVVNTVAGNACETIFNNPRDVILDEEGNFYVADTNKHQIKRIDKDSFEVTIIAGDGFPGLKDGLGGKAQFRFPSGIAFDPINNNIYVSDTGNNVIRTIELR